MFIKLVHTAAQLRAGSQATRPQGAHFGRTRAHKVLRVCGEGGRVRGVGAAAAGAATTNSALRLKFVR